MTDHLFPTFHQHKAVLHGEAYDYFFSYAVHWHELQSVTDEISDHAKGQKGTEVHRLTATLRQCVELLERDFEALFGVLHPVLPYLHQAPKSHPISLSAEVCRRPQASPPHWTRCLPGHHRTVSDGGGDDSSSERAPHSPVEFHPMLLSGVFTASVDLPQHDEIFATSSMAFVALERESVEQWAQECPLVARGRVEAPEKMKPLIRRGVPHSLRGAVWTLTTGARQLLAERPNLYYNAICNTFAAAKNVRGTADMVDSLHSVEPSKVPLFGGRPPLQDIPLNDRGVLQWKLLLCVLAQNSHVTHCPMLPTLVAILLLYMSETNAYATAKQLLNTSGHRLPHFGRRASIIAAYRYIPVTAQERALCHRCVAALARRKLPVLAKHLERLGVEGVPPALGWFDSVFTSVLPLPIVLDMLDAYFLEGLKIFYRVALALLRIAEKELLKASSAAEVQNILGNRLPHKQEIKLALRVAYSFRLKRQEMDELVKPSRTSMPRATCDPVLRDGLYHRPTLDPPSKVALSPEDCETFFYWLTTQSQGTPVTNLQLAFSTWRDGFSLKTLYTQCQGIGPNILLVKALPHANPDLDIDVTAPALLGAYSSDPPRLSKEYYGSGGCFVFRLTPDPECWPWTGLRASPSRDTEEGEDHPCALFLNGESDRLLFGGGGEGPALVVAGDLQTATTNRAATYDNDPLCCSPSFDIQHLEIYAFGP